MTARVRLRSAWLCAGWVAAIGLAVGVRGWNALYGPRMWGYDAWGHVAYVFFLDVYRSVPWADQGWSYFHPPLHYGLGWALAQWGDADVLMRGLALLGSVESLATAGLAAWLVRRVSPEPPGLSLLAFVAVAFLPVHVFMSPMPGNELTRCLLAAAALCVFIANESRDRPSLRRDAVVGLLLGLALLTKFNGALPLLVVCAWLVLRALPFRLAGASPPQPAGRTALRVAIVAGIALAVSAPYYARNLAQFGSPFELSRGYPLVAEVERGQPPGARGWRDYVNLSPRLFSDPNPMAPHLVRSVWGTVYLNVWADIFRESDVSRALEVETGERRSTTWMAMLGLLPTVLAAAGGVLAARDLRGGRRVSVYGPLLLLCVGTLGAFAVFAWRVPLWSALKASYLLGLSLPYAVFLARALEALGPRTGWLPAWRVAAATGVAAAALAASAVGTSGVVLERRADAPATGAVDFHFGEYDAARRVYGRLIEGSRYPVPWLDNLAAVELADGHAELAVRLYGRAVEVEASAGRSNPRRRGQLAAARAVAGDLNGALALLDDILMPRPGARAGVALPELRANRGAVRAAGGDLQGAERDLRSALEVLPSMVPAWRNLAGVLSRAGRHAEVDEYLGRAAAEACRSPRGYPYGVGTGEILEWGVGRRWLLLLEEAPADEARGAEAGLRLRALLPADYREACRVLGSRSRSDPGRAVTDRAASAREG